MQISRINRFWREGRYLDLWSVNHVLSGVVLAALFYHFAVPFYLGLCIAIFLFVGWEVAEVLLGIKEHVPNMVTDVICDLAGFLAISYYITYLNYPLSWYETSIWITIFMIFNVWGFFAYEERKIEKIAEKIADAK